MTIFIKAVLDDARWLLFGHLLGPILYKAQLAVLSSQCLLAFVSMCCNHLFKRLNYRYALSPNTWFEISRGSLNRRDVFLPHQPCISKSFVSRPKPVNQNCWTTELKHNKHLQPSWHWTVHCAVALWDAIWWSLAASYSMCYSLSNKLTC